MKHRISVSIDENIIPQMRQLIRTEDIIKNKSQLVEHAIKDLIKRKQECR